MIGVDGAGNDWGNRFYLSYSGSAPSGANCVTLAGDVAGAWNTNLAPIIADGYSLTEVDVLDIATDSGLSGQWTGSHSGSAGGNNPPAQVTMNVELGISRRYRGGKPRIYLPGSDTSHANEYNQWSSGYLTTVQTAVAAFFSALEALSVGSMGTLAHVSLSYYKGFTNITNSSGRERAVPTYRTSALVDAVTGYFPKAVFGSQKRRRTSTTP